jgi:Ca-activated chloride channel homolog
LSSAYPFEIAITVLGNLAEGRVASPSHSVVLQRPVEATHVKLEQRGWLDRDFVLVIDELTGLAGQGVATMARYGAETVVLASFCPDAPTPTACSPAAPLACKILVDCSGSMKGDSIDAAKRALQRVLKQFRPKERFSFSRFGTGVMHFAKHLIDANSKAIAAAFDWVSSTEANMGGTNMFNALFSTFSLEADACADVLLITDGEVWNAEDIVLAARRAGQRVFAVGIGSAPAESLLRKLAEDTGGACEFIAPNEDVELAVMCMFARMRQPRLTTPVVDWNSKPLWQTQLPNTLFGGDTVHAFASFTRPPADDVVLRYAGWEESGTYEARAPLTERSGAGDTLARMAAFMRLRDFEGAERNALALQYQLVTEDTSLVAVHQLQDADRAQSLPQTLHVGQMLATGWGGTGTARSGRLRAPACWSRSSGYGRVEGVVDYYDIPAFLRKDAGQVDQQHWEVQPEDFLNAIEYRLITSSNEEQPLPTDLKDLQSALPEALFGKLVALQGQHAESNIVRALLHALLPLAEALGLSRRLIRLLRNVFRDNAECSNLREAVAELSQPWRKTDAPTD